MLLRSMLDKGACQGYLRQAGRHHLQLVVGISLVSAGRAVVGDRDTELDGGASGLIAVVMHPEAAIVAARHVAVGWEPHLHVPRKEDCCPAPRLGLALLLQVEVN